MSARQERNNRKYCTVLFHTPVHEKKINTKGLARGAIVRHQPKVDAAETSSRPGRAPPRRDFVIGYVLDVHSRCALHGERAKTTHHYAPLLTVAEAFSCRVRWRSGAMGAENSPAAAAAAAVEFRTCAGLAWRKRR